jgi:hypothetical protein
MTPSSRTFASPRRPAGAASAPAKTGLGALNWTYGTSAEVLDMGLWALFARLNGRVGRSIVPNVSLPRRGLKVGSSLNIRLIFHTVWLMMRFPISVGSGSLLLSQTQLSHRSGSTEKRDGVTC